MCNILSKQEFIHNFQAVTCPSQSVFLTALAKQHRGDLLNPVVYFQHTQQMRLGKSVGLMEEHLVRTPRWCVMMNRDESRRVAAPTEVWIHRHRLSDVTGGGVAHASQGGIP